MLVATDVIGENFGNQFQLGQIKTKLLQICVSDIPEF